MINARQAVATVAETVVDLFPGGHSRGQSRLGNITVLRNKRGTIYGLVLDGGGPDHQQGFVGPQRGLGIDILRALGEGMESASQTGIEIRTMKKRPKSLTYHFDLDTGIETMCYGLEAPAGTEPRTGAIQGLWNKHGFALVSKEDKDRCLHTLARAIPRNSVAFFLSDKKGESDNRDLGIFLRDEIPEEFQEYLNTRDARAVDARHQNLVYESEIKGARVLVDSDAAKKPVGILTNDSKAA